ncbi:glycosyltransferase family 2 protein [Aestuariivirga sp.]|uniref:glycosyltransferase family 2 protein n=1 Tax=Aestuariivirga sp. TaxID=2650926 RepID=UPI00301628CE
MLADNDHQGFGEVPAARISIAGGEGEVLLRLSRPALCDLLRRLPKEELEEALRTKIMRAVSLPGLVLHAACGQPALRLARARGLGIIGYGEAADFLLAARAVHRSQLLRVAIAGLARRWPMFSARGGVTAAQVLAFVALLAVFGAAGLVLPGRLFLASVSAVSGISFLGVVALRLLCLMPPVKRARPALREIAAEDWPVYSILVPLFREVAVLPQLMTALRQLSYPAAKLDIKLILEEEDILMQRAVAALPLEAHFEVIIVPASLPQTKPRALNYALQFCRGELLTIYDAEDVPERDQLQKAARRFAAAPRELACLQAQLTFYNENENWLTRQFTAEYATLFGELLPMLANHNLPLPLGGTSNHFRMDVLRSVGAWDPYNVTEDADLGLRLARLGYDTGVLDSFTFEEANTRLGNWIRQRARWLKGFLMTWLVHMREPERLMREMGPSGFWAAQVLTLGVFASVLLHPLCMAATVVLWVIYPTFPRDAGAVFLLLSGINLSVLVAGYAISITLTRRALLKHGVAGAHVTLATMPLYWILMSFAAWLALWQFFTRPFHWNKTEHGLSSVQPVRPGRVRGTASGRRRWWRRNARQGAAHRG